MSSFSSPTNPMKTTTGGIASDVSLSETPSLIAASRVNGTNVYNRLGDSIGSIYDVMIDKRTGRVEYAIMSFGGFLGLAHNLPNHLFSVWSCVDVPTPPR